MTSDRDVMRVASPRRPTIDIRSTDERTDTRTGTGRRTGGQTRGRTEDERRDAVPRLLNSLLGLLLPRPVLLLLQDRLLIVFALIHRSLGDVSSVHRVVCQHGVRAGTGVTCKSLVLGSYTPGTLTATSARWRLETGNSRP